MNEWVLSDRAHRRAQRFSRINRDCFPRDPDSDPHRAVLLQLEV